MGRKNNSNQLPIDHFRRTIGDNQRKRQKDQISRLKNITDKRNENRELANWAWKVCLLSFGAMLISSCTIAGMKYYKCLPINNSVIPGL